MYVTFMGLGDREPGVIFRAIVNRIFLGQTDGLYYIFHAFPTYHDFLWGRTLPNPMRIFPFEPFDLSIYICSTYVFPGSDIVCTSPTVFFGEVYANFGYGVMMMSMVAMGVLLQMVQIALMRWPKSALSLAVLSFFTALYPRRLSMSSMWMVLDPTVGILVLSFALLAVSQLTPVQRRAGPARLSASGQAGKPIPRGGTG